MSMMKQQLETLAARMNDGDTTITDELMGLVGTHNVSYSSSWRWTDGLTIWAGGVGALAKFLRDNPVSPSNHPVNDTRLSIDGRAVYTHDNGG